MKKSIRWGDWAIAIIGGAIATVTGGLILYYINDLDDKNNKPPTPIAVEKEEPDLPVEPRPIVGNNGNLSGKVPSEISSNFDQILPIPNYIEGYGVGEDMFDAEKARTQARNDALSDLINKFPDKEQLVRRYAKIIRDTVVILDRGVYSAQIVMQIDEHRII